MALIVVRIKLICLSYGGGFASEGHVALDRNPLQYLTLTLDPRRSLKCTLPGLLDSRVALSNFYPNACMPSRKAVLTIFMMVFGMTRQGL